MEENTEIVEVVEQQEVVEPVAEATEVVESKEPVETPQEIEITIGDEPAPEPERAPEWVRELRKQHRELQKKVREYEEREKTATPAIQPLGPKPKLEDHDYDTERYEEALESWYRQRDLFEASKRQHEKQVEEAQRNWQAKLDSYGQAKDSLRVKDFDEAESLVQETLNVIQQGVILSGADDPAKVVYALGKNPKKAKELAAITDPVKFSFAVAKLEAQLKVTQRKPPPPESVPVSTGGSNAMDSTLEKLREEAARTGDMTKVLQYKRQMKSKAA